MSVLCAFCMVILRIIQHCSSWNSIQECNEPLLFPNIELEAKWENKGESKYERKT